MPIPDPRSHQALLLGPARPPSSSGPRQQTGKLSQDCPVHEEDKVVPMNCGATECPPAGNGFSWEPTSSAARGRSLAEDGPQGTAEADNPR